MDESSVCVVTEVCRREVEEVDHQEKLSPEEVGAHEEHDESEVQEVVENKVASNTCRSLNMCVILGEEVGNVTKLEEVETNPGSRG